MMGISQALTKTRRIKREQIIQVLLYLKRRYFDFKALPSQGKTII